MTGPSALVSLLVAWWLTGALARGRGILILDHPNERSLHTRPTPRTGGLAIVLATLTGHIGLILDTPGSMSLLPLWGCAALVFVVSLADDLRQVPAAIRLLAHLLAAAGLVVAGLRLDYLILPGLELSLGATLGGVVTVLFVAWLTNLYNFMDGIDGVAGGMGVLGFGCYALLAWRVGAPGLAASCLVIAAACAGFLGHNFPPARIFMGDAGSSVLGFLAAGVAVHADVAGLFPLWISVMVFSPFIVDATLTLVRRAVQGQPVWKAHRAHYYQRLVGLGWTHRRTTLWEYALMAACGVAALFAVGASPARQATLMWGCVLLYAMLSIWVRHLERRQDCA